MPTIDHGNPGIIEAIRSCGERPTHFEAMQLQGRPGEQQHVDVDAGPVLPASSAVRLSASKYPTSPLPLPMTRKRIWYLWSIKGHDTL